MYSFNDYSADIEQTRKGIHNTVAYNCLGLIGELGELVTEIIHTLPESSSEIELEVLKELNNFVHLSRRIELLKKNIRKAQIKALNLESLPDDKSKLEEELGGIIWYLDTLANNLKISLGDAAYKNQEMLIKRFNHNPNWMTKGEKLH